MLVYEERVAAPHIDILKDELFELRIVSNTKVDHPRKKSKDLADAMCGSVYNAIAYSQRNRIKEIDIHTWSRGGVDSDSNYNGPKEKVKTMWAEPRYRMM